MYHLILLTKYIGKNNKEKNTWNFVSILVFPANDKWRYNLSRKQNLTQLLCVKMFLQNPKPKSISVLLIPENFDLQCRVVNKPYDIFGTWYSDQYLLSGELHWLYHLVSSSHLWLNKASQEAESELVPITHCLFRFYNRNASSIRAIMIANCLPDSENAIVNQEEANELSQVLEEDQVDLSQHGNPVSQQDLRVWANAKRKWNAYIFICF